MRIRTVKPELWGNEKLSQLPEVVHLSAAAILNYADDEGYFNANPGLIKAAIFPLREPSVPIPVILRELSKIDYLQLGRGADGRQYGRIVKFGDHQSINKPRPSQIKDLQIEWEGSERTTELFPEDSHGEWNGREQGKVVGARAPVASTEPAVASIPLIDGTDFPVWAADVTEWMKVYPAVDVPHQVLRMREWCLSNPTRRKTRKGARKFITDWLGKEQDKGHSRGNGAPRDDGMAGAV